MKHRATRNPFPLILRTSVTAVLFAFGFALLSTSAAHAAVIDVSDPSKSSGPSAGEFDVPDCDDLNGDRHQPDSAKGYRWDKTVTDDTVTLKAVPLEAGDVVYAADDDDATYTYPVPDNCVPVDPEPKPDRSVDPQRGPLPATGAEATPAMNQAAYGLAAAGVILLCGLDLVRRTRIRNAGKHRG